MDDDLRRYRQAMSRLRHPFPGQGLGELPEDPDTEHVPEALRELEGKAVTVSGIDRNTGELVHERGSFTTAPGIHGDLARRDEDSTR
jgi:hypothetical protein